jgi:hypothetical protein
VKETTPPRKTRRLPSRSPSLPDRSRNPPKVSRYAFTTQASDACEKPRSVRMEGRATFTMLWSSTIIRSPRHSRYRASQRLFEPPWSTARACGEGWWAVISFSSTGKGMHRWNDGVSRIDRLREPSGLIAVAEKPPMWSAGRTHPSLAHTAALTST